MTITSPPNEDSAQLAVLRQLEGKPRTSQRELASSLNMSLGRVNYCLRALMQKGFVKMENYRKSENKRSYFYFLTPSGLAAKADLTKVFLARKVREYEALHVEIEQLRRESESNV